VLPPHIMASGSRPHLRLLSRDMMSKDSHLVKDEEGEGGGDVGEGGGMGLAMARDGKPHSCHMTGPMDLSLSGVSPDTGFRVVGKQSLLPNAGVDTEVTVKYKHTSFPRLSLSSHRVDPHYPGANTDIEAPPFRQVRLKYACANTSRTSVDYALHLGARFWGFFCKCWSSRRLHVLLVEDSLPIQKMMKRWLEMSKCTVDVASNGELGLFLLQKNKYAIVFSDFVMVSGLLGCTGGGT